MLGPCLLLLYTSLTFAVENQGPDAAPFPDTVYPAYVDPRAAAGAQSNQRSPPSYPSPWMSGTGDWADAYAKAQAFVSQLTLAEKVNLTTGVGWEGERCVGQNGAIPRLGFRSMCMQDSPVGVRDTDYNSVFPGGGTIAASWDRNLFYLRGYGMGQEHAGKGVDAQLGPVVGPLGRSPEGGRGWEGFSPDPVLSGIAVAMTVKGIQDAGVIATTKHFIANEQEHFRQVSEAQNYGFNITEALSSNIDDTTMHELYLWPFADAVRAGTAAVMCSYNQVNNSYGCANSYTLNHLLKNELGFQGFVMSDWQAQHSGVGSALAGLDMTMPGDTLFDTGYSFWGTNLTIAVLNGTVPQWRVDDMATRIIAAWYYVGRDQSAVDINFSSWTLDSYGWQHFFAQEGYELINEHVNVQYDHSRQIRNMSAKSTVLLKNIDGALPLTGSELLTTVFGDDAGPNPWGPNGCPDRGCDNGTLGMAWGSGTANFPFLSTPMDAIQHKVIHSGGGSMQAITDNYAVDQIAALARQSSVAIVFVNADSGEGYIDVFGNEGDRNNLTLWRGGDQLIKNVASNANNTVVVIHSTGPVLLTDWYDHPNISAILWAGIPGQHNGNSIVDVLYGHVNPGGKLPFTLGQRRQDYGTDLLYKPNSEKPQDNFQEGVFIDYRAFDKMGTEPVYEFGYGISYTSFAYSNLQVVAQSAPPYAPPTGMTQHAPKLGSKGNPSDYVYPTGFHRVPFYIYPFINSTNLKASSGDPYYGEDESTFVPPGAKDGSPQPFLPAGGGPGGNPGLYDVLYTVSATITNTGGRDGDEVVQLYISLGGPDDPKVVLRNFDRLSIPAGASATFTADITRRDVSNWDTVQQNWVISEYAKRVYVGSSSRKLLLKARLPAANVASGPASPAAMSSSLLSSMTVAPSSFVMTSAPVNATATSTMTEIATSVLVSSTTDIAPSALVTSTMVGTAA